MNFTPNLSITEIALRYGLIIVIGILAGFTQQYWIAPLAIAVFVTCVTAWCPICDVRGINHNETKGSSRT